MYFTPPSRTSPPDLFKEGYRVVHITPFDGLGGVETAARSLPSGRYDNIEFLKLFIARKVLDNSEEAVLAGPYESENNLFNYFALVRRLLRLNPAVIIGSLWRSCMIFLPIKLLRPHTKFIVFLHLPTAVHWIDYICNRLAMSLATEIWTDSEATLAARVPAQLRKRARVISFVINSVGPVRIRKPEPRFIFWGRLDRQKGIERALRLFALVRRISPDATYTIIGPDSGYRQVLERLCGNLGIDTAVRFLGPKSWNEIRKEALTHSFYLQTSEVEGMALSVVEAMQLGLVPVVTGVGEIGRYCTDGQNCVLVHDDAVAAKRICELLASRTAYQTLATNAGRCWVGQPLYRDCVLAACRELVQSTF